MVGLLLVHLTRWYWLDGAIACLVGLNILVSGWRLVRQSFSGLMDASDPELMEKIADLLIAHRRKVWIDIHQLRAWSSGNHVHIDFHLILPRTLILEEAHREGKIAEALLEGNFKRHLSVLIHLDPCLDPNCPICRQEVCGIRSARHTNNNVPWSLETLIRPVGPHGTVLDDPVPGKRKNFDISPEKPSPK